MVTLKDLLSETQLDPASDLPDERKITGITADSRKLTKGNLFVAVKGHALDGHAYIHDAVKLGASAILASSDVFSEYKASFPKLPLVLLVEDTRSILGILASRWYGCPTEKLDVFGVTGTNGKTTTTILVAALLQPLGLTATLGTVEYRIGDLREPAGLTTPDACKLNEYFNQMVHRGAKYCAMEVSSHSLVQGRVNGTIFKRTVFTNLTQDHLDYHGDLESYFAAKRKLFTQFKAKSKPVINIDDAYGKRLYSQLNGAVVTYGFEQHAMYRATNLDCRIDRSSFQLATPRFSCAIAYPLIGKHNVYNFLAAAAVALEEGVSQDQLMAQIPELQPPRGRLERLDCGQPFNVFVDYAHSPDAMERTLSFMKSVKSRRLITVFGCGGDRDKTKRPIMGRIAALYSDIVILTNDNPRTEDPQSIVDEIKSGMKRNTMTAFFEITDRKEAIAKALSIAQAGDVVAILGKGHEEFQIIGDEKLPFSDQKVIQEILKDRKLVHTG